MVKLSIVMGGAACLDMFSNIAVGREYIGSTTRLPASRVAEHFGRNLRANRILAHPSHSNIREHAQTCGSFDNIII